MGKGGGEGNKFIPLILRYGSLTTSHDGIQVFS